MPTMDDNSFKQYRSLINEIKKKDFQIPDEFDNRIDETIQGLKRNKLGLRYIVAAFVVICTSIFISLNLFPSLAAYALGIPGLNVVVEWLVIDKGIQVARINGYKNLGPIIAEKDGYILKLDDIFFDDTRIRFSSLLTSNEIFEDKINSQKDALSDDQKITNPKHGSSLKGISYSISFDDFYGLPCRSYTQGGNTDGVLAKKVELEITDKEVLLNFLERDIPYLKLTATIYKDREKVNEISNIRIPFKRADIFFSTYYNLKGNVSSNYGDVQIKGFRVSPTRMILETESIDRGDMFITGFDKVYLRDDKGNVYMQEKDVWSKENENIQQYYFVPSIFFNKTPRKLYFCYEGIRVGIKTEKTLKVNLNDNYPRTVKYLDDDIILEDVQWLDSGVLQIKMDFANHEMFQMGSIMLSLGNKKISSDDSYSISEGINRIKRVEYFNNVPYLSEYEIELLGSEFFTSLVGEIELVLN